MNLLRHFQDDENNSLSFDIIPMPGDHSERFNLNGSLLEYDVETYGLPDFEDTENQILTVSVRAKDVENVLYSEIITLTVEILQFEESPLVYDEDGVLESFYDTGGILNQKSKPIVCDEDPDSPVLIDHLQFKDPEGSSVSISLTNPSVDDNGTLTISPPSSLQPNYQFSNFPPENQSGRFEISLNVTDEENTLTKLTLVFDVTPSHDPPFISWTAPVHVEATDSDGVLYLGLEEGDAFVLKLEADDSQDGVLEEKTYFDWVLLTSMIRVSCH